MFLSKLFYLSKQNDLVSIQLYFNSFPDSLMILTPSRLANYAKASKESCNGLNNLENYDPRCRPWYADAYKSKSLVYSPPFLYQSSEVIGFSASLRSNTRDGSLISILNQNMDLKNIKSQIFAPQDIYDDTNPQEAYTVLIYFTNQTVYHHRSWDPASKILKSWIDLEYNSSTYYDPIDKTNFSKAVNQICEFALNGNYDIAHRTNTRNFFFTFKRQNQTYLSILYPVLVMSIQNSTAKEVLYSKHMLVGRVQKDRTHILEEVTLKFLPLNSIIIKVELGVVFLWLCINILHFAVVLYKTQEIPLQNLIMAIKNNTINQEENKKQRPKPKKATNIDNSSNNNGSGNNNYLSSNQIKKIFAKEDVYPFSGKITNSQICTSSFKQQKFAYDKLNKQQLKQSIINQEDSYLKECFSQAQLITKAQKEGIQAFKKKFNTNVKMKISKIKEEDSIDFSQLEQINKKEIEEDEDILISLDQIEIAYHEMDIIVHSIQGIFNLLKLAKMNSIMGNNDISILQFYQALDIFIQVKNLSQQVICYEQIGNQYLQNRRYTEAADSYQSALTVILQQLDLFSQEQLIDSLGEGNLNNEKKQLFLDYAHNLKMLAISQNEENNDLLQMSKWTDLNLQAVSLKNINKSIDIFYSFSNQKDVYFQLIQAELVKAKILFLKDKIEAFNYCNNLEIQINNQLDLSLKQITLILDQNFLYEQVLQQIFLVKQKIFFFDKDYETCLKNILDFLENNEYLLEIARFESLQLISQIQLSTNMESNKLLQDELEKFQKSKVKMWILIEIDSYSNLAQFERYQSQINQILQELNDDDVIQFIIYDSQILFSSSEFNSSNKLFLQFCFKELKNQQTWQIIQLKSQQAMDWVQICSHTLTKILFKSLDLPSQLKQWDVKNLNKMYEKQVILLLTSNDQNQNLKSKKLNQVMLQLQKIIKKLLVSEQKVFIYHLNNFSNFSTDIFYQNLIDSNIFNMKEMNKNKDLNILNNSQNTLQIRSFTQSTMNTRSNTEKKSQFKITLNKEIFLKEITNHEPRTNQEKEEDMETDIQSLLQEQGIKYFKTSDYSQILTEIKNLRYKKTLYYQSGIY